VWQYETVSAVLSSRMFADRSIGFELQLLGGQQCQNPTALRHKIIFAAIFSARIVAGRQSVKGLCRAVFVNFVFFTISELFARQQKLL